MAAFAHFSMTVGTRRRLLAVVMTMVAALACGHPVCAEESPLVFRWTTNDGHVFQAKFLRVQATSIVVVRDGFQFTVPDFALSAASLDLARRLAVRGPAPIPATHAAPIAVRVPAPLLATYAAPAAARMPVVIPATHAVPFAARAPVPIAATQVVPFPPQATLANYAPPIAPVASFSFGPSILAFCRDNIGKKIGSGQCASLASQALKSVGAAVRGGADWPGEGDYVWGEPVAMIKAGFYGASGVKQLSHVEAGDIVQFHHARFAGYGHSVDRVYNMEARHHTAVVESVDLHRQTIDVLHQNWNGQMIVRRQTLYLGGMTGGWLRFYRPIPTAG